MSRDRLAADFAAAHGFPGIAPLAQDASFRRYWRAGGARRAVLMDAPPPHEDVRPFLALQARLAAGGLSVPAILAADPARGFLLIEDFGDALFSSVLPVPQDTLYDAATDALTIFHRIAGPAPNWSAEEMIPATAATFLDWWWPAMFAEPPPRAAFAAAMRAMLAPLGLMPAVLVHRDYFAGNLFWLPGRAGAARVGIIDFQDAAMGPPAYDLVSLTQDARRDLPPARAEAACARYLAARPELSAAQFEASFAICAAQRHLRVAALWVRLARRDNKPGYLVHGPRCWALLARALAHPATAPLAAFLDRHVPPDQRRNPD